MKIALTYSSKMGLFDQYLRRYGKQSAGEDIPVDFFAEGDSSETIQAIIEALAACGYQVQAFEAQNSLANQLEQYVPDLVFNVAEGLWGDFRESFVPMICEQLNVPYTGSGPLTLAVCLNKARSKEILSYHGIATPEFSVFYPGEEPQLNGFAYPAIVKPVAEGSSKGIFNDSVVDDSAQARYKIIQSFAQYDEPVLLEKFITGDEYTVALWGNGNEVEMLPIVAIDHSTLPVGARPIYSYEAKWLWDVPENPLDIFKCPARLPYDQEQKIEHLAKKAYHVLGIRDWCRIDIRFDHNNEPNILELNPIPGILPDPKENSCFPKAARTAGYNYQEMLQHIVLFASRRYGLMR
jgi:D-alanine-D-alanine ligase